MTAMHNCTVMFHSGVLNWLCTRQSEKRRRLQLFRKTLSSKMILQQDDTHVSLWFNVGSHNAQNLIKCFCRRELHLSINGGISNHETHLYLPHNNLSYHLTTEVQRWADIRWNAKWLENTTRLCTSSLTSASILLGWPCQEQCGSDLTASTLVLDISAPAYTIGIRLLLLFGSIVQKNKLLNILSFNVQSTDFPMDYLVWQLSMTWQFIGCWKPVPSPSASMQWNERTGSNDEEVKKHYQIANYMQRKTKSKNIILTYIAFARNKSDLCFLEFVTKALHSVTSNDWFVPKDVCFLLPS